MLLEMNYMFVILGNVIKVALIVSRGGRRINKIISPLLYRGGGLWDLDGEERGKREKVKAQVITRKRKHKQQTFPPQVLEGYTHTRERTIKI